MRRRILLALAWALVVVNFASAAHGAYRLATPHEKRDSVGYFYRLCGGLFFGAMCVGWAGRLHRDAPSASSESVP